MRRVFRSSILLGALGTLIGAAACAAQPAYRRARVVANGQLQITTSDGREIVPPRDSDQVGFDQVAISPDRQSVGWLALYPNCCTSYPIPLKLVVLTDGTMRTFTGEGLAVWRWSFSGDGKRVAFRKAPVHGTGASYELRDITTNRLVSSYDEQSDKSRTVPDWVRQLKGSAP